MTALHHDSTGLWCHHVSHAPGIRNNAHIVSDHLGNQLPQNTACAPPSWTVPAVQAGIYGMRMHMRWR